MKNVPIFVALIVSACCSYILLSNTKEEDIESFQNNAVGIEIGVFKDLDSAKTMQKRLGGYIIKDADLYRIYYGILKNDYNLNFLTNYLNNLNISFYTKKLFLNDHVLNELEKCESILNKEKNEKAKIKVMLDFIKKYEEVI